jgi:dihydroxyacetone kinase-like protein
VKKFINDPKNFVDEFLEGVGLASDGKLAYEPKWHLIYRTDIPKENKVTVIQGSGSGHEPAHTMIVGKGMLDGACPGDVFAGPPVEFVYETAKKLYSQKGIVFLVNNYTGDRTAWEMAKEMSEADGMKVGWLLVNDDVAVKDSTWTVGRRGVAGNFFVIKAVGAASEEGASLEECVRIGEKVIANVRTMGIALSSCTPPVRGTPLFEIADDEMEVGIGIHGEPGRQRTKVVPADQIVDILLDAVVPDLPFKSGDEVALMINGLGGTPISEMYLLYGAAHKKLEAKGIKIFRSYVGEYCTSLEMAGASLTLCKVDDELKRLLLAPADVAVRVF